MMIKIAHAGVITEATSISVVLFNMLEFLLSIFGIIAIITLVFSGLVYLTAGGNENQLQKAKKMTLYSMVGIVIAIGSVIILRQIANIFA